MSGCIRSSPIPGVDHVLHLIGMARVVVLAVITWRTIRRLCRGVRRLRSVPN